MTILVPPYEEFAGPAPHEQVHAQATDGADRGANGRRQPENSVCAFLRDGANLRLVTHVVQ